MSSSAVMPMPMRLPVTAATYLRVRGDWQGSISPVSAGAGRGSESPIVCVTTGTDLNLVTEFTKAHGTRRSPEPST